MTTFRAPLLALCLMAATPVFATDALLEPAPITVTAKLKPAQVQAAIKLGMAQKNWIAEDAGPGLINGTFNLRAHQARVTASYTATTVTIRYLDSNNLKYDANGGKPEIHGNYNKWVAEMVQSIEVNLQRSDLATVNVAATAASGVGTTNPPPHSKFSDYTQFELQPVAMGSEFAGQTANDRALIKIQEGVTTGMGALLASWTNAGAGKPAKKLIISPEVEDIRFISGGVRFMVGAMAGSSRLKMKVTYRDAKTNEIIAAPQFNCAANALTGAWSVGGSDNRMLTLVPNAIREYSARNYLEATAMPVDVH